MRFLVTAGPTREPLDPVRYLSNRSSGKMGYALARAVLAEGHECVLISGPVNLPSPPGAMLVKVETSRQMYSAVQENLSGCDVAIFAAAVADYRPAEFVEEKIKKDADEMVLRLVKNPDILGSAREIFGFKGVLVGFAAETRDVEQYAMGKMRRKGCDLLVANDVSRRDIGFDSEENEVILLAPDAPPEKLGKRSKDEVAKAIIARCLFIRNAKWEMRSAE